MFAKQMGKFADVLVDKDISKREDKEIIVHGLTTGIELIFNIISTIVLGLVFGQVLESLVFSVSYPFIRSYAGGFHFKKALTCYFVSCGMVVSVLAIVKFTPSEYILVISIIMLLFSVPVILKFAPIETPTKPLDEAEQKYFRKKTVLHLGVECVLVGVLFILNLNGFGYVVCLGIMMSAGLVFLQKRLY